MEGVGYFVCNMKPIKENNLIYDQVYDQSFMLANSIPDNE